MTELESATDLELIPVIPFSYFILLIAGVAIGTSAAVLLLPSILPGLHSSINSEHPKAFWYLSRSSAMVAFILLWLSMALGLMITNKLARIWPGGPIAYDVHQFSSIVGLAFAIFHALILLGDAYISFDFLSVIVPFVSHSYRPFWVGIGQVSLYLMAIVILSFYLRKQITRKGWRLLHFTSYLVFLLALIHGVASGSDTQNLWVRSLYWLLLGSILFLTVYRVLTRIFRPAMKKSIANP